MPADLKGYLYLALALISLCVTGVLAYKLYHAGEQTVEAHDQKAATKAIVHNTQVESNAQIAQAAAESVFQASHAAPAPAAPAVVCVAPAARARGEVSGDAASAPGGHGAPAVPAESDGPPFTPGPGLVQAGHDADAQIALLQALIREYQAAGVVAK